MNRNMHSFVVDEGYRHPVLGDDFALVAVVRPDSGEMLYVIAMNNGEPFDVARFWIEVDENDPEQSIAYTQTREGLDPEMEALLDAKLPILCHELAEALGADEYIETDPQGFVH
jgi:hypothetical protein